MFGSHCNSLLILFVITKRFPLFCPSTVVCFGSFNSKYEMFQMFKHNINIKHDRGGTYGYLSTLIQLDKFHTVDC